MKILNFVEDLYYNTRDRLLNSIACWCIRHCALYSTTIYTMARKVYVGNWKRYTQICIGYHQEEA